MREADLDHLIIAYVSLGTGHGPPPLFDRLATAGEPEPLEDAVHGQPCQKQVQDGEATEVAALNVEPERTGPPPRRRSFP